jgi:hypothetical protein
LTASEAPSGQIVNLFVPHQVGVVAFDPRHAHAAEYLGKSDLLGIGQFSDVPSRLGHARVHATSVHLAPLDVV